MADFFVKLMNLGFLVAFIAVAVTLATSLSTPAAMVGGVVFGALALGYLLT